MDKKISFC